LDGIEKEMHEEGVKQLRMIGQNSTGIAIPEQVTRAAQTVGVAADGGNSVYTEYKGFKEMFKQALVLPELGATVITGLQGNLSYVTEGSQIEALWEGETTQASEASFTLGNLTSSPKRLSRVIKYSNQLLRQSVIDVESMVQRQIAYALAYALQKAAIAGSGTGNVPLGLLAHPDVLSIALGTNGGNLTYQQIVAMETLVADKDALQGSLGYVMNAVTRGMLKTTEKTPASPSGQFLMPTDGTLNGYKVALTNYMTKAGTKGSGTNLSSMIYGDWSQLEIHRWGAIDLTVDKITLADQALTKVVVNDFANILIVRPTSFVKVTDIKTS
jgi:HK97 family phage major capsid protein